MMISWKLAEMLLAQIPRSHG